MKTVKLFSREEIEKAKDIDFFEVIDSFSNDCAIPWWVSYEDEDWEDEQEKFCIKTRNKITDYLISQGAEEDELVYIDITW
jgi:hypothetical protein